MSVAEKLKTIAENEQKVYDAGYEKGKTEGDGGYEEGRTYERDGMWKALLNNGSRICGDSLFRQWSSPEFFKPTCNIKVTQSANSMFRQAKLGNLITVCEECGIVIDLSSATNIAYLLADSTITHFPTINCANVNTSGTSYSSNICSGSSSLKEISFSNVPAGMSFSSAFVGCTSLEELRIGGTIEKAIYVSYSEVLSKESHINVINSLSTTTSGLTVTFNKIAVNNAFGINVDDEIVDNDEWNALVASRENWKFSFV